MQWVRMMQIVGRTGGGLVALGSQLVQELGPLLTDDTVSLAEVETFCRSLSDESGDLLKVHVAGQDIIGKDAQADLAAALGRILARAARALDCWTPSVPERSFVASSTSYRRTVGLPGARLWTTSVTPSVLRWPRTATSGPRLI